MSNLKVDAKTNILEFKRKHNLLVENSAIKIEVSNINSMTDSELDGLKCGDIVAKKTGNQFHNYIVTYKEEEHGICLSYYAAGYIETVSYDYTDGHWVYNSTDVFNASDIKGVTTHQVNYDDEQALPIQDLEELEIKVGDILYTAGDVLGIITKFTNFDIGNELVVVWFVEGHVRTNIYVSDGQDFSIDDFYNIAGVETKLYKHEVKGIGAGGPPKIIVYDTDSSKITTSNVATRINNSISAITNSSKITFADISGTNLLLVYFGIIPPSSVNTQVSTSALSGYTDDVVIPL